MQLEEDSNLLNCYYKFISAKNFLILFISSDDFTCLIWGWKIANMDYNMYIYIYIYIYICMKETKNLYKFKFSGESTQVFI